MKKINLILFGLIAVALIFGVVAENIPSNKEAEKGKNLVEFGEEIYAKQLVILNPHIEYIACYDEYLGKQLAFVNVFGGIGQNFLIVPEEECEISFKYDTNLLLPEGNSANIVE